MNLFNKRFIVLIVFKKAFFTNGSYLASSTSIIFYCHSPTKIFLQCTAVQALHNVEHFDDFSQFLFWLKVE